MPSLVSINGVSVLSGSIMMPLQGVWTGDLVIDQPDGTGFDAGTPVAIVASNNGFTINGVVSPARTGDFLDAVHVRVLGGAGGMAKDTLPRAYVQPGAFGRDVVNGLLSDSGETLSTTADATLLTKNLTAWSVMTTSVAQALELMISINSPGDNWRLLADGTLWVGAETWPQSSDEFVVLSQNPADGTFDLGVDSPSVMPGVSLSGVGNVNRVEHTILSNSIRSRVWIDFATTDRGLGPALTAIVKKETAELDYFALYYATVVSQQPDGSLDVTLADPRLAGMSRVAIRYGIPGYSAQIIPGCNILVGWADGNPSKPYVALWGGGESVTSSTLNTSTSMTLGGPQPAIDFLVKGTTYRSSQSILDTQLITELATLGTSLTTAGTDATFHAAFLTSANAIAAAGAAATAASIAIGVFEGEAATYLSTVVKTV